MPMGADRVHAAAMFKWFQKVERPDCRKAISWAYCCRLVHHSQMGRNLSYSEQNIPMEAGEITLIKHLLHATYSAWPCAMHVDLFNPQNSGYNLLWKQQ